MQSYSLFIIFKNYIYMKTAKLPKNELGRIYESNLGHTEDEWGTQKDRSKNRIIEAYDLKWNVDKKNDD